MVSLCLAVLSTLCIGFLVFTKPGRNLQKPWLVFASLLFVASATAMVVIQAGQLEKRQGGLNAGNPEDK